MSDERSENYENVFFFFQYATLARKGWNQMSEILSITNVSDEW